MALELETQEVTNLLTRLSYLDGASLAFVGNTLYIAGGHYYNGTVNTTDVAPGHEAEKMPELEEDQSEWLQNKLLYAIDMSDQENNPKWKDMAPYTSIIPMASPATRSWGGAFVVSGDNSTSTKSIIQVGGLQDPPDQSSVPFWSFNSTTINSTGSFETLNSNMKDTKSVGELFNMYDGTATSSPNGEIFYLGGVDLNGNPPEHGNRLAKYDTRSGEVAHWNASGEDLRILPGANLRGSSMVWLPYGEEGVLVNMGGLIVGDEGESPNSLDRVMIFDIASSTWFSQPTAAGETNRMPKDRSHFCSVVASPAPYRTSYEIHFYGGLDLEKSQKTKRGLDDVWTLTVPTFQWIQTWSGNVPKYNRSCALAYDRWYMLHDTAGVAIWDTQEGIRFSGYDPSKKSYKTPFKVQGVINGKTSPPDGWASPELSSIFSTTIYNATKSNITASTIPSSASAMNPTTNIAAIVGGVLGAVVILVLIAIATMFFRRRRRKQDAAKAAVEMYVEPSIPPVEMEGSYPDPAKWVTR